MHIAAKDAAVLLDRDPELKSPRGRALRPLMRMFQRAEAVQTLASG